MLTFSPTYTAQNLQNPGATMSVDKIVWRLVSLSSYQVDPPDQSTIYFAQKRELHYYVLEQILLVETPSTNSSTTSTPTF